ncbi:MULTISPECIES: LPS export ABC transporter permease LptF [Sphingopyxis]|uniref:Lipopolysaccharide export system permease protein n=1 Tax=Sphingopyxis terrae subsp. ummariensis TaxID=429001 RepID=A0A1Y6FVZ2_9SPHN|nr:MULTISPECIES: LPS export ABC transporter permease LptF [Sphingopyxis]KAB2856717.1 MAG: LPS export ABC transporter permease LptF [Sphingopyxis terrae]ENY81691.1 permease YjgP/YjgQ [Sphingopyxis sp. MC1]MBN8804961.1 LPS export ABC transporter permease LptF [Sphingopyxis terrae]PCF91726.1 LPS export ABC transporter permease LptF [Sphingopyxis terrae subsp. ummariensis]SMQ76972.1 lipopolysaccharide export system permease protein [Sphingopyxis terrae subsp. ummariensis]
MNRLPAIDRYIARLIFFPMLGTLVLSAMLLVLEKMLRLFDFVATEGGPVSVVWRMLANLIPEYLSLGIPIGLMLGILLAFRRLATSSELDVLRGVGMSFGRLMRVPYAFAFALALLNLAIVGFIQPYARYAYEGLRFELRSGALGASIKVGEFTKLGSRMTLRIEQSYNEGRNLRGIFVRGENKDGQSVSATAAEGQFLATDDPDTIILRLTRGVLIHESPKFAVPRVLTFDSHDLPIPLPKIEAFRTRGGADRELTIPELLVVGHDQAEPLATRLESRANFHFRIVEVVSMFFIPLMAIALAIPPKRSTSSLGVFLSIVLLVTQHKINEYAEALGARGAVDPLLALWIPLLLFGALAVWMYYTVAHVPGGQPIGALERVAAKAGQKIRAFIRLFQRKQQPI